MQVVAAVMDAVGLNAFSHAFFDRQLHGAIAIGGDHLHGAVRVEKQIGINMFDHAVDGNRAVARAAAQVERDINDQFTDEIQQSLRTFWRFIKVEEQVLTIEMIGGV